ncbi:MAG: triose-phosphate isomerase [candidate division WOR-3 bacterium]|nr:triose-phosphate isomerase [candidate division WOR-3 bacterium]MCX7756852.1 triose-phosphate isomerase [candidate division WOR-3 bacterium]MDW7987624.1 triose-phosphate isomerase [candidate division WOR-3 bacterium]
MRQVLIAANWKMNKTPSETKEFVTKFKPLLMPEPQNEVVICAPFTSLALLKELLSDTSIKLGAQNMHWELAGAYTGEISGRFLKELGCEYIILGHSERRQYFGETDSVINKKVKTALALGLKPILCVGESLYQRETNQTLEVIRSQLRDCLSEINVTDTIVIAYEPVWAIGTGKSATPKIASEVHEFIRKFLTENYGASTSNKIRIIYGGSVNPANISELLNEKEIDGVLVGNASLVPESFRELVYCEKK